MPQSLREESPPGGGPPPSAAPAVAERVWGLDIGRYALKALQLGYDAESGRAVALAFDLVEYPDALGRPQPEARAAVAAAVAQFRDRNDLEGCRIAVSAAGRADLTRFLELPPGAGKRLRAIMAYEADLQIPIDLKKVSWEYQAVPRAEPEGGDDPPMVKVGLFALTLEQIEETTAPLRAAGLEVDIVQTEPVALANFAGFDLAFEMRGGRALVLLDVGPASTDLLIHFDDRHWRRVIPIGGNHFTGALMAGLKLSFAKAEHVKCNFTRVRDAQSALDAMSKVYDDLMNQIERSLGFFAETHPRVKIGRTLLLGGGTKLPGLAQLLPRALGASPERLAKFDRLLGDDVLSAPMFRDHLASFAVAYGLGIQALGQGRWTTNLLPPDQRPRRGWSLGGLLGRLGRGGGRSR